MAAGEKTTTRKLTVVVGAVDSSRSLGRCLESLRVSCTGLDAEIVVAAAGPDDAAHASSLMPDVRTITMPVETLTPVLWSEGIASSSGDVVALTTGHCFVTPDWARSLLSALESGAAAIGGPMRLAGDASLVDAAIFFLRYSAFLEGLPDGVVRDIAGDNAAYVREKIPGSAWSREGGFWEVDVNREILAKGGSLRWASRAVAEFGHSFHMNSICRHRFAHGRLFGRSRASGGESGARIIAGAPAVPFVLLSRIAKRVARRPAYRREFVASIPAILALATCWASGEAAGAFDARIADRS